MTPTIRIDHEVYEKLQEQAQPFVDTPNTILRRLLDLPEAPLDRRGHRERREHRGRGHHGDDGRRRRRNRLEAMLEAGVLNAGDTLVWERPRSGERFVATLTDEGRIQLEDGSIHDSPSGAGKALNGYDANGWVNWRVERTGESLRDTMNALRPERPERGPHRRGKGRRPRPSD